MPPWSFVGRNAELTRVAEAASGSTGRGLILGGPPGIGKSRLLREGVNALDQDRLAVWTATANAATAGLPLGGLAQVLPPDQPAGGSPAGLLRWAVDALHRQAAGRPIVVAIDDAHLLDPLSAALVYYVARSENATVIGTVRTGEPVHDPISALWKDDLVERIELGPLTLQETSDLLQQVLGGPVDSASVDRLWQLSQGNALLLRELVIGAHAAGEIIESYGMQRWTGKVDLAPTLTEVVDARIGKLTPQERAVLELVAFGEPIGLPLLVKGTDLATVETAEERQLVRVVVEDRRTTVRLAHPLYGEVVRRRCPVTRNRRLLADLASLVENCGARRRDDLLRVAVWRLDSDTARDPVLLLNACRLAFATYDMALAMRLGRAAVAAGGGFDAAETLATILMFANCPDEGALLLDQNEDQIGDEGQRSRWLAIRHIISHWGVGDSSTADEMDRQAHKIVDLRERSLALSVESTMRLHRGDFGQALTLARTVLDSPASAPGPRALARSIMGHLQAMRGTPVQTVKAMALLDADATQWRAEVPYIQLGIELARGTAMILAADLGAVDAIVATEFAGMADAGNFLLGSGYLQIVRAQAARLRGHLQEGGRAASQASAMLATGRIFVALAHAERAHIAALQGDAAGAAAAFALAEEAHYRSMEVLYPWLEEARAWVAVAAGDVTTAAEVLRLLAARNRSDGFAAHEMFALYDLGRLGFAAEVNERIGALAQTVEGRLAPAMAWHVRAMAEEDGGALLSVAEELADMQLYLFAAEAAAGAVTLLRGIRSPQTPRAAQRLAELRVECPHAVTPALVVPQPMLTGRERQIARLAAAGVPSKEIADQLYLSSRTVDNHLMRVYAKLGVTGRAELAAALRSLPPEE
ncbi:LuxR C-terminal-related transcriptional regulator [Dactylosporangium sp. CS-033363]|uniref:LuxR C-terminal-related transcriptional regulator n=1 Tax=Dactylosporangium sp. CS-033363 TaxID=3239935 RepID=UPI003D910C0C